MSRSIRQERNFDLPKRNSKNFRRARLQTIAIKKAEDDDLLGLEAILTGLPAGENPRSGPIDKLVRL